MHFFIFIFLFLLSPFAYSAEAENTAFFNYINNIHAINADIVVVDNETHANELLNKKNVILSDLFTFLKNASIDKINFPKNTDSIDFLNSKIKMNIERNNLVATQRDQYKIKKIEAELKLKEFVEGLLSAKNNYLSMADILEFALKSNNLEFKETLTETGTGKVYIELKNNYNELQETVKVYHDIVDFIINNPGEMAQSRWIDHFSIYDATTYLNNIDALRSINYKLSSVRIDMGGIIVSLCMILFISFSYPYIFKFSGRCLSKYCFTYETTELFFNKIKESVKALFIFFSLDIVLYTLIGKTAYSESINNISFIIYTLIIIWLIFKTMDGLFIIQLENIARNNKELRKELIHLGIQMLKGSILILGVSLVCNKFGVNVSAILSTLGLGGLAFALAAKDSLSNLFGGVTILFDNVFKMGDSVEINGCDGAVVEIGLRSTTIRTFDNALVTIPNSVISVSSVKNWNRRSVGRLIKMHINVSYDSDMNDIKQAIEDVRIMLSTNPDISDPDDNNYQNIKAINHQLFSQADNIGIKSTRLVYLDQYNESSIDILVYCFSKTIVLDEWLGVKEDVLYKISDILKQNNLKFAYPTAVRIHRNE